MAKISSDNLVESRWHKTRLVVWYLQFVPFVRLISVTGSLAYNIAKPTSDIDMFLIAKKGHIWTARAITIWLLKLIGQYHYIGGKNRAGKICPNRFVNDEYLLINPQNYYHAQDYTHMVPLFDEDGYYDKFIQKNSWMTKYGCFSPKRPDYLVTAKFPNRLRIFIEKVLIKFGGAKLETYYKNRQLNELSKEYAELNQPDSAVYANDNEIRVHPAPRR